MRIFTSFTSFFDYYFIISKTFVTFAPPFKSYSNEETILINAYGQSFDVGYGTGKIRVGQAQ